MTLLLLRISTTYPPFAAISKAMHIELMSTLTRRRLSESLQPFSMNGERGVLGLGFLYHAYGIFVSRFMADHR